MIGALQIRQSKRFVQMVDDVHDHGLIGLHIVGNFENRHGRRDFDRLPDGARDFKNHIGLAGVVAGQKKGLHRRFTYRKCPLGMHVNNEPVGSGAKVHSIKGSERARGRLVPVKRCVADKTRGRDRPHRFLGARVKVIIRSMLTWNHPNVPIKHRVAVALKLERAPAGIFLLATGRRSFELKVLMDRYTIVFDRDHRILGFPPGVIVFRRSEVDIVGLPVEWRKTHVHGGRRLGINAAALVIFAFESERIQHLQLITVLQIDAAVAAVLPTSKRFEREQEFKVRREIRETRLALATGREQMALVQVPAVPRVGRGAVEQHSRARWRLGA